MPSVAPEKRAKRPKPPVVFNLNKYMTCSDFMKEKGVSRTTVHNAIDRCELPGSVLIGDRWWIPKVAAAHWQPTDRETSGHLGGSERWRRHRAAKAKGTNLVAVAPTRPPRKDRASRPEKEPVIL